MIKLVGHPAALSQDGPFVVYQDTVMQVSDLKKLFSEVKDAIILLVLDADMSVLRILPDC